MSREMTSPGLYFAASRRLLEPSPLRSDIAGFVGRTRRGLVGEASRVEGWRGFLREFGGLIPEANTPFALSGYFDNGGEIAHVVRLAGDSARPAGAQWTIGDLEPLSRQWLPGSPAKAGFRAAAYSLEATSPGVWANGLRVSISYRFEGAANLPAIDMIVQADGEPVEFLTGLEPKVLAERVTEASLLIKVIPVSPEPAETPENAPPGPRRLEWELTLSGGSEGAPVSRLEYLQAVEKLGDVPEVALVALPDLYADLKDDEDRLEVLGALLAQAEQLHDRLILVDLPPCQQEASLAIQWINDLCQGNDPSFLRAAAVYHPHLLIPDPFGGIANPLRTIPPSGHIAGLMSELDRLRGAHHTPANARISQAVDATQTFTEPEQVQFQARGINPVRCFPGRGLQVWGGWTLGSDPAARFVAHRRLIHLLVRAIRRVAEPLVFDANNPEMWLKLVRGITTVLLEAYRAGALQGARPDEAFRVRCDETTTSVDDRDAGIVQCEIAVAPGVPMEFILLRVALSAEGNLEVIEA